jgi:hypothetical protein
MTSATLAAAAVAILLSATAGHAAERRKPPASPPAKRASAAPIVPEATPEQLDAAQRVFYGRYICERDSTIEVASDSRHGGYVQVRHGKTVYLMKPVLSKTGAIRLEDVKGAALVVQIASKSMLLDLNAGRRLVDGCVSEKQRELTEAAAAAEAAASAAAASAASAASAAAASAASAAAASAPATGSPDAASAASR